MRVSSIAPMLENKDHSYNFITERVQPEEAIVFSHDLHGT